jgi:hypothetical protein
VFVTCLCVPQEVPDVPGMKVRVGGRPDMCVLVAASMTGGGSGVIVGGGGKKIGAEKPGTEGMRKAKATEVVRSLKVGWGCVRVGW